MTLTRRRPGGCPRAGLAAGSLAFAVDALIPRAALAHAGEVHGGASVLSPWDLAAVVGLLALGTLYARGSLALARRGALHRRAEPVAFALGWTALLAAVLPPLDGLAIDFFAAHMAQHELMMLVGVPLVLAGRPLPVALIGLGAASRPLGALLAGGPVAATWRALTIPLVAWILHGAAVWIWHVPALYEAAVGNEAIHAFQHATFVVTSALFWWGMLYGRYGRAGYGAAVFYVFTTTVHTGILGALLTLGTTPVYPGYAVTAAARGVDPVHDQQLGGLLMWVPAGFVLTVLGIGLFAAWMGESARRDRQARGAVS